jgi:LacI family transcriptional regulator
MATIRDIAKMAGVSVATVSRVLNKKGYVSLDTEKLVLDVIDKVGFQPNSAARVLAGMKLSTIALIVPDISNPFFSELARAVEDAAQKQGYTVFLCNTDNDDTKEKAYIEALIKKQIDGVLFCTNTLDFKMVQELKQKDIAIVSLDRAIKKQEFTVIQSNNFEGAQLAVNHLLQIGCKKIAHIYGPQEYGPARDRLLGFESIAKHQEWYTPSLIVPSDFTIDGGRQAVNVLLDRHPDIDGIFAGNDLIAIGALKELHLLNKKVPEDIAICGFDNIQLSSMLETELTTIAQPIADLGKLASEQLIHQIKKQNIECKTFELDVHLIERASTQKAQIKILN